MTYDTDNVFARILRGELPCDRVYEDEYVLAFNDVAPKAPVHVLVIPKGSYVDMDDFARRASKAEMAALLQALGRLAEQLGVAEKGYRALSNIGRHGHQEVPHLHFHLLGGRDLGPMIMESA